LETIYRALGDAKQLGATVVSVSGGEPLIYPHIFHVLEHVAKSSFACLLYTSGVVVGDDGARRSAPAETWSHIRRIFSRVPCRVIFDLQGPAENVVDPLMGYEGAFSLITESIASALAAGLLCEAHTVPMKPNFRHLPATARLAEDIGLSRLSVLRFVPQGRGQDNHDLLALSTDEFLELQHILHALVIESETGQRKLELRLGCPVDFLFAVDQTRTKGPCRGGNDAPLILPDGAVHMCPAWKNLKHHAAGNIHESSLADIWRSSDFYSRFRNLLANPNKLRGACGTCEFVTECKGGCTAQRVLCHGPGEPLTDCLYLSPDPLCPLLSRRPDA
jgi:radical SAM protein with 4Fe4S-binding SPASM domain